jgi:hypothetical protein
MLAHPSKSKAVLEFPQTEAAWVMKAERRIPESSAYL